MTRLFVPLDVNYFDDDKIIEAGPLGELLYVRSLAFAKRARTDGHLADSQLQAFGARIPRARAHAERLYDVGLWERNGGGLYIRAWHKRNSPVSDEGPKGHAGAHARWHVKARQPNPDCELCVKEGLV